MNPLSFWRTHFDFWMSIFVLFWPQIRGNYDQNLNIYRSICISCIYGPDWDFWFQNDLFWPQNDLFWPFWWPWMALNGHFIQAIRISIEFESNHMHIMRIWPCFRFLTPKWSFSTPYMTSNDFEMHIIGFRRKFPIKWYAYQVHLAVFPIFDPKWPFLTP